MGSKECAELIRRDRIDILVELTGHTAGNRLDVMAHKPSPVQATWIGYPNTTGLPTIDYRFTDEIVDPSDTKQEYVENLIRFPGPFLCYTPPSDAPEVSVAPILTNGFVTFGSFNNLAKINDRVLAVWCAILKRVADSRMLLKCKPFACPSVRKKILERFEQEGVEAKRVDLIPLLPTTNEHLQSYSMVDISLDTYPYAGTTTTCEALYMGVPVVTLRRVRYPNHAHNVGATLLSRIRGLERFITTTEEQYIKVATECATNLTQLAELRRNLRPMMVASPLCDGKNFGKHLETSYVDIWRRWCLAPQEQKEVQSAPLSSTSSTSSATSTFPSSNGVSLVASASSSQLTSTPSSVPPAPVTNNKART